MWMILMIWLLSISKVQYHAFIPMLRSIVSSWQNYLADVCYMFQILGLPNKSFLLANQFWLPDGYMIYSISNSICFCRKAISLQMFVYNSPLVVSGHYSIHLHRRHIYPHWSCFVVCIRECNMLKTIFTNPFV